LSPRATSKRKWRTGVFVAMSGVDLPFIELGRGRETVVVIPGIDDALHGVHARAWLWSWYFQPLLDLGYRVILLGRGRGLPAALTIAALAESYAEVIERRIGCAHLVGISMGGMIAQHVAATHPELVRRLVLAVTAHHVDTVGHAHGRQLMALARAGRWHGFLRLTNELCFSGALRWLVAALLWSLLPLRYTTRPRESRARAALDFCASANACAGHDGRQILARIQAPTMIWGASADRLFPARLLAEMRELLPRAQLVLVRGTHAAFLQRRSCFHGSLAAFLEPAAPVGVES
jgi:pimeloyl-ACP methyl ester carboxylesterase